MTKEQLAQAMAAFEQEGGKVESVEEGVSTKKQVDPLIRHCQCGCNGDWTEHTMRAGESGRDIYTVIR